MGRHLAEMLLELKLHGKVDRFRKNRGFSDDIQSAHAILFNADAPRLKKLKAYRTWLQNSQPCVFGRVAAKNENIFICLLEEHEILRMKNGDPDLRDTIQDARQSWKRHALDGRHSSFLILLLSPSLVTKEPNDQLKEVCRRLMELYMEIPHVADDTIETQREYVFLRGSSGLKDQLLKFSTLPNVFCAQGDGRWWYDHRTPGGIMITSNALGHFVLSRSPTRTMGPKEKVTALENAMRTINNAFVPARKTTALKHCPATRLLLRTATEATPVAEKSDLSRFFAAGYTGFFHTDHLIPSVFFHPERDHPDIQSYEGLDLNYIFDAKTDPKTHAELMTGEPATWYEIRQNMNRLPSFVDPEQTGELTEKQRGKLTQWADERLNARLA
jgi:hypothetical protein